MSIFDAILLGLVQGLTEFLPISSSGHLVLGQYVLGLQEPQLLFDIILHVGTLGAVIGFYREDLAEIWKGVREAVPRALEEQTLQAALRPEGARLAFLIFVACLPTGILGVVVDKYLPVERGTQAAAVFVCGALVINGLILFAGRLVRDHEPAERTGTTVLWNVSATVALAVGTAQGLAVIPGFSRSGLTIICALFLGVWRTQAARLSFLMSVPAILGALALKFDPAAFTGPALEQNLVTFTLGAGMAAVSGYAAIKLLVRLIEEAQFHHFSWYCWAVGGAGLWVMVW